MMICKKSRCAVLVLLGPKGSFSDVAAGKLKSGFNKKYVVTLADIFKEAAFRAGGGNTVFGLVPVKNKIIGAIKESKTGLKSNKWVIKKRFKVGIKFVLARTSSASASRQGGKLENIKYVYCTPVAKAQCAEFLRDRLPCVKYPKLALGCASTSATFKKIVQLGGARAKQSAAIGNEFAAKLYGLKILARDIQDKKKNWTEFAVFCKRPCADK